VRVAFHPAAGTRSCYRLRIHEATITHIAGQPTDRSAVDADLRADDTVIDSGPGGTRVRILLQGDSRQARSFVVRFDRAAQLVGIDTVEGLPSSVAGSQALPDEVFLAAGPTPPNRALAPGESWNIDIPLRLPGTEPGALQGTGRLDSLAVIGGRKMARIYARTRLPVKRSTQLGASSVALEGVEVTESTAIRALSDGSVESVSSTTHGEFSIGLAPAAGTGRSVVGGTLSIDVSSRTRRVRDCPPAATG